MDNRIILFLLLSFSFLVLPNLVFSEPLGAGNISLEEFTNKLFKEHPSKSGAFVLEKGVDALLTRALLTDLSANSIDVQYFIWSTDNIGILAAESLLRAAERGTHVRVIVDGNVAITGGRNMADEYFDYDSEYNFRDRDILLLGPVVAEMEKNFERFWQSHLTVSVGSLLEKAKKSLTEKRVSEIYSGLHAYALNPENYEPEVQQSLNNISDNIPHYAEELIWEDILFVSDIPGKNTSSGFQGGGKSTETLVEAVKKANKSITIQSPYLVFPNGGIDFFGKLINKGVEVKIITNSLAATDNLQAFSGYSKQRKKIIKAGIKVYEFRPDPAIQKELINRYEKLKKNAPIFAIHAKTMVIDGELLFIGTFNLDPRSANLNTEVGVMIRNKKLASQVEKYIEREMMPGNSWNALTDDPDTHAPLWKRLKVSLWKILPINSLL